MNEPSSLNKKAKEGPCAIVPLGFLFVLKHEEGICSQSRYI